MLASCSTLPCAQDGHLFLGPDETVGGAGGSVPVDFQGSGGFIAGSGRATTRVVDFPVVDAEWRESAASRRRAGGGTPAAAQSGAGFLDHALLERYAPASALIDRQCRVRLPAQPDRRATCSRRGASLRTTCSALAREGLQAHSGRRPYAKPSTRARRLRRMARVRRGGALHPMRGWCVAAHCQETVWRRPAAGELFRSSTSASEAGGRRCRRSAPPPELGRRPGGRFAHRADGRRERGAAGLERGDQIDQRGAAGLDGRPSRPPRRSCSR